MNESLSPELLDELSKFVVDQFGLEFSGSRKKDLERALKKMAERFKFKSTHECINWLLNAQIEQDEMGALAEFLTIGETYFFRDQKMLSIVEKIMIPMILREKEVKKLRIWSAGCSTGEEPYTIAILLNKIMTSLEGWDVNVLASDVNPKSLEKLNEGVYREWSFRDVSQDIKKQYFHKDEKDNYYILPVVKKLVSAKYLNLALDRYPSSEHDTSDMDFILCRNVLMYFDTKKAKEVVRKLTGSLALNGFLIVSPCEYGNACFSDLESVSLSGMTFYKKQGSKKHNVFNIQGNKINKFLIEKQGSGLKKRVSPVPLKRVSKTNEIVFKNSDVNTLNLDVENLSRTHANAGDLKSAEKFCKELIAKDPLNVKNLYLLAVVCCETKDFEEARKIFKKILYLDQSFILAHFNLGCIALKLGRLSEAKRYFEKTITLSESLSENDIIPGSEGMTKGALLEAIDSQRGKLSQKVVSNNER